MSTSISIGEVDVTWLGHASVMIFSGGMVIYIDPYKVSHGQKADIILITHEHYDHCDPGSIAAVKKEGTVMIAPKACKDKIGKISEIKAGQTIKVQGVEVSAVPAYNVSKHFHPEGRGVGYVVNISGIRIYHAGDTGKIPEMEDLSDIDLALLPVGGTYTMNAEEAAEVSDIIMPKMAIPIHWGDIVGTRKDAESFRKLAKTRVEILD